MLLPEWALEAIAINIVVALVAVFAIAKGYLGRKARAARKARGPTNLIVA